MTLTLGHAFCFAATFIGVIVTIIGIAAVFGAFDPKTQNEETLIKNQNGIKGTNISQHSLLETNQFPLLDKKGRNLSVVIEDNCLKSSTQNCNILKNSFNTKITEWITQNNLTDCAIVKMAENNCEKTIGLECDENSCSLSKENELRFWFQDYFVVTKENSKTVETSPHLQRFTCINKDETSGIKMDSFCIRNLSLVLCENNQILKFDYVVNYLAKNLRNYTSLPKVVAQKIEKNLPYGTGIYSNEKKLDSKQKNPVYVFPSPLMITREAVSWMRYDSRMSNAICNSLGLRKLIGEEINALPDEPDFGCFFDESGNEIKNAEPNVWAFGKDTGTYKNHVEITNNEALMFSVKKRNVLYVKDTNSVTEIPDGWVKIHKNVLIKKNGSLKVDGEISCNEFEENQGFNEFLNDGGCVILQCKEKKSKFNYYKIDDTYLYSKEMEKIPEKCNVNLLQSSIGELFFVRFMVPNGETELKYIDSKSCKEKLTERFRDPKFKISGVECHEKNGKTYLVKE